MARGAVAIAVAVALSFFAGIAAADQYNQSVGPGTGVLQDPGTRDFPCGFGNLTINSDDVYENGYAWQGGGSTDPPEWGSFAERYMPTENLEVCGLVFDLTSVYDFRLFTLDGIIWADDGGIPGNVLAIVTGFDPWPIAAWPNISRHTVQLVYQPTEPFWVGYWVDFGVGFPPQWYVAADIEGTSQGSPFTKIAPGIGYPTGWHNVSDVWGPTNALGLGYYGHQLPVSSTPASKPGGELASWGKVKALYR